MGRLNAANTDGSIWTYNGTAANTTKTGWATCTGWTLIADATAPNGIGYLRNTSGEGGASTWRLDANSVPFAGDDTDYWLRFWCRPTRTANALNATMQTWYMLYLRSGGGGGTYGALMQMNLLISNLSFAGKFNGFANSWDNRGYTPTYQSLAGSYQATEGYSGTLGWNVWNEIIIHVNKSATGYIEMYQNGVLVNRMAGMDTTQIGADLTTDWLLTMGMAGMTGCYLDIAGPFESWNGTDITITPRWSLWGTSSLIEQMHPANNLPNGALTQGCFWNNTAATGSTVVPTAYASSNLGIGRRRFVCTKTSGTGIVSMDTINNIGTLGYNSGGWETIAFPMVYVPNGTASLVVSNAGNTGTLVQLDIDASHLSQGGSNLCAWTAGSRYAVLVHLHQSGAANYTLMDLTVDPGVGQIAWSGQLNNWTPGAIGQIHIQATLDTIASEFEGVWIAKWIDLLGIDSLVSTNGSYSPVYRLAANIGIFWPHGVEALSIPGGAYWQADQGLPFCAALMAGCTGGSRTGHTNNVIAHLNYSRGIRMVYVDGGSVNDLSSVTNAATRDAAVAQLSTQLQTAITTLTAGGNRVLLGTMWRREGGGFSVSWIQANELFSNEIRRLSSQKQSGNLVSIADANAYTPNENTAGYWVGSGNVHLTDAGCQQYAGAMAANIKTPAASGGSGGGFLHIGL